MLVSSKPSSKTAKDNAYTEHGCGPCNKPRCSWCLLIEKTTTFTSTNQADRTFDILHIVNCQSAFVIYIIECKICKLQYVGKSETLDVTSTDDTTTQTYIGVLKLGNANDLKTRYRNQLKYLRSEKYKHETELSKHVWNLRKRKSAIFDQMNHRQANTNRQKRKTKLHSVPRGKADDHERPFEEHSQ